MKNQQTHQSETSIVQVKKGNGVKRLPIAGLMLEVITTAFVIIWLTKYSSASSSWYSAPSEIASQEEFQDKWNTEQEEFEQIIDAATKEAAEREMELHFKSNTAQDEY